MQPGELLIISRAGLQSEMFCRETNQAMCAMEYIYFSRPDSNLRGMNVHTARKKLGKALAQNTQLKRMW